MYNRILLKLSGEALTGGQKHNFDNDAISQICEDIYAVHNAGHQIALVVGGGNICRGANIVNIGIERINGDNMGMLATVINALALQSKLESMGLMTRVQSAIPMATITEPFIRRKAIAHMEKGRVVIFSAGTGNPFFTTDTAAILRAIEVNCDVIIKATHVDGVYSSDPKKNSDAKRYDTLTYKDVMDNELNIMDSTAISLARDNKMQIIIFNIHKKGELLKVINGSGAFSLIK